MLLHVSNLFYYLLNKTLEDSKTPVIRRVIDGTEECIAKDDDDLFIEEQSFVTKIFVQASFFELFRNRNLVFFFQAKPIFQTSPSSKSLVAFFKHRPIRMRS